MSSRLSVNYSKGLLAASQAAEQSYNAAHQHLEKYCEKQPEEVGVYYGGGCGGTKPNERLKLAKLALEDLESRHKIFQSCVRKALKFPNPTEQDAEKVFDLLQLNKFYKISLQNPETAQDSIESSDQSQRIDLAQQSRQAVPKISEFARANLVAIGATLKNARIGSASNQ